jgi:sporulation integral membrane protein YlbJ
MSGYPVGARLTAKLRQMNLISKADGNRLISFSSTSGPLFILGTVLIGMVGAPKLAGLMIIPHYLGAITIGLIFRFYKGKNINNKNDKILYENESDLFKAKKSSIGSLIAKSIKDSMESIILIGGFVIIYSVIIDILLLSPLFDSFINLISRLTSINSDIIKGIIAGIIEITNGCEIIAKLNIDLLSKIIILNFIIGWGGFSIHSQALSFINSTDISSKIYLISKALHGLLASIYTYILYLIMYKDILVQTFIEPIPVFNSYNMHIWIKLLTSSSFIVLSAIIFITLICVFVRELQRSFLD